MSDDIDCPYCGEGNEIDHDDGYGWEEGERYEQDCSFCDKVFEYETVVTYMYYPYCKGEHKLDEGSPSKYGNEYIYACSRCEHMELRKKGN
jgi:hypothetical protein